VIGGIDMTGKEAVEVIMKLRGMSTPVLAKKLGYATTSGVSERLRGSQDMRADTLAKFLDAMDCEIIIRSKLDDRTKLIINGDSDKKDAEK